MKNLLLIIGILIQSTLLANMAQPYKTGTLGSSPFTNQYVDVVHEYLHITIDPNFQQAHFEVEYQIKADTDGIKIPLLFYASEYYDDFVVSVDGKIVAVKKASEEYLVPEGTVFEDFAFFFEAPNSNNRSTVSINRSNNSGFLIRLDDMLYFETDISKGAHTIHVSYNAFRWEDDTDWIKKYSFRYAFSPAKYWRSFGYLEVVIESSEFEYPITTNFPAPATGDLTTTANWHFAEIPLEVLEINYQPEIGTFATFLTKLTPLGIALIMGLVLIVVHYILIKKYRKINPTKKWSWTVFIGGIIVPLLFVLIWVSSYQLIDSLIGTAASGIHGYSTFFILVLYPIITPIYFFEMWILDRRLKKLNPSKN